MTSQETQNSPYYMEPVKDGDHSSSSADTSRRSSCLKLTAPEPAKPKAPEFSTTRKILIVVAGFTCTFNGNLGSSVPSGAIDAISEHFGVADRIQLILLNSLYMSGYVLGPLVLGPLSEYVGRRPVLISTYLGYIIFMFASAMAPTYTALLIFRLICGINAAAPTTIIGGLYADILHDPNVRGNAMALYMTITSIGPLTGPIFSGYSSVISWQWPFFIAGIIALVGLPLVLSLPETFAPVLHNKAVKKQMKKRDELKQGQAQMQALQDSASEAEKGQQTAEPQQEVQLQPFNVRKIFLRPMTLLLTEPIVLSTSAYLTLAYALFFLMFQAYPIVFQDFYGLAPGPAALAYIPSAIGAILAQVVFSAFTWYHARETKAGAAWTKDEIYRRLPLACIASPLMVVALFWLGWTVWPNISPIVPMINGVFFCCGFQLLFMGMVNYLTDTYLQDSASVLAAASVTRSIGAVLLPLGAGDMYETLGIHWAPSVLGFVALAMGVIPFIFIRFGDRLAQSSKAAKNIPTKA